MNRVVLYFILYPLVLASILGCQRVDGKVTNNDKSIWPVSSYNFGDLEKLSAKDQVSLLRSSGYQGILLRMTKDANFEMLPDFLDEADKFDDFNINAVFVRYNFSDPAEKREKWIEVIDQVAEKGIQLWVIFGKPEEGYDELFVENKLREIVNYATPKKVEVILYPHSWCFIETAEEGMPFIEKIDHDNLKVAFHFLFFISSTSCIICINCLFFKISCNLALA